MTVSESLLFVFGVIGLCHIIVDSKVMMPLREWFLKPYWPPLWTCVKLMFVHPVIWLDRYVIKSISQIMACYQCSGFWAGMIAGWMAFTTITLFQIVCAGFAGSFLASIAAIFMNYLEARTIVHLDEGHKDG